MNNSTKKKQRRKAKIKDNSNEMKKSRTKQEKSMRLRIIEFWVVMALVIVGIGGYAVYLGFDLYPEYEAVKNDVVTMNTLAAWAVFLGVCYFLISIPFFHSISAKLKGHVKVPKTDYVVIGVKLVVFAIWIYVSRLVYYDNTASYDEVEKLIILGVFGGTVFVFDVVYFLVLTLFKGAKTIALSRPSGRSKAKDATTTTTGDSKRSERNVDSVNTDAHNDVNNANLENNVNKVKTRNDNLYDD